MKLQRLIIVIVFLAITNPVIADQVNADGSTVKNMEDGTIITTFNDSITISQHPGDMVVVTYPDGMAVSNFPDNGTTLTQCMGGMTISRSKSNNKTEIKFPGGAGKPTIITEPPEDTSENTKEMGDRSDVTKPSDIYLVPEGSTVKNSFGPLTTWITPDGSKLTTAGPVTFVKNWPNSENKKNPDNPDVPNIIKKPDGTTIEKIPNGPTITRTPDGTAIVEDTDGSKTILKVLDDGSIKADTVWPDGTTKESISHVGTGSNERWSESTTQSA